MTEEPTVSLHHHLIRLLEEHNRLQDTQLSSMEKAEVLARDENNKQFHALNELRKEVVSDRSQFVPINVYDTKHEMLRGEIGLIHSQLDKLESRINTWGAAVAVFAVVLQLLAHFIWGR